MGPVRILALFLGVLFALPVLAADRVALVIGNNAYAHLRPLENATNDAVLIHQTLTEMGYDAGPEPLTDLGFAEFSRALRDFSRKARNADVAVLYYAGHGMEIGGVNYLIPVDAELADDGAAAFEAVALNRAIQTLSSAGTFGLVLLDACRNDPFANRSRSVGFRGEASPAFRGVERVVSTTPIAVAFAAELGRLASDGEDGNSPYATALARHLPTPGLEFDDMLARVGQDVLEATDRRQNPDLRAPAAAYAGYSLLPGGEKPKPATAPDDWDRVSGTRSVAVLEAFIEKHPDTIYAALAQERINQLEAITEDEPEAGVVLAPTAPPVPPTEREALLAKCLQGFRPLDKPAFRFSAYSAYFVYEGEITGGTVAPYESFLAVPRAEVLSTCAQALVAAPGSPYAQLYYGLARLLLARDETNGEALFWLMLAARSGHPDAAAYAYWARGRAETVYTMLESSEPFTCQIEEQRLIDAASSGHPLAEFLRATRQINGNPCEEPDFGQPVEKRIERAAELGFAEAQSWLATHHLSGDSEAIESFFSEDKRSHQIGYFWLDKAIENGNALAALTSALTRLRGERARHDATQELGLDRMANLAEAEWRTRYAADARKAADEIYRAISLGFEPAAVFVEKLTPAVLVSEGIGFDPDRWERKRVSKSFTSTDYVPAPDDPHGPAKLDAFFTRMQELLAEDGYYTSRIDGKFGRGSRAALRALVAASDRSFDLASERAIVQAFPASIEQDPAAALCFREGFDPFYGSFQEPFEIGTGDLSAALSGCYYAQLRFPDNAALLHMTARVHELLGHELDLKYFLDDARQLYSRAAAMGIPASQYRFARLARTPGVVEIPLVDMSSAQRLNLRKAADAGYPPAVRVMREMEGE